MVLNVEGSDVDPIQGLIGVETALMLKDEYRDLLDLQIVAFPQEGWLKTSGVQELMEQALEAMATRMPIKFETSTEDPWLNGVLIRTAGEPMRATAIEQVLEPAPDLG